MLKIKSLSENQKQNYLLGSIALVIIVVIALVALFSDVLVDKPEQDERLFYTDEEKSKSGIGQLSFTLGSSKDDVSSAQGKPSNILGESWYYGASRVDFEDDSVIAYSDRTGILNIELKPKIPSDKEYFELGLTKDEVLSVQGRPSNIIGSTWYYSASKVEFIDGKVATFSDRQRILKVRPKP